MDATRIESMSRLIKGNRELLNIQPSTLNKLGLREQVMQLNCALCGLRGNPSSVCDIG
jgi:hypothetical protein